MATVVYGVIFDGDIFMWHIASFGFIEAKVSRAGVVATIFR